MAAMTVQIPHNAITDGPSIVINHVDGPLLTWGTAMHWLTWSERFQLHWGLTTVDQLACKRWPSLAKLRDELIAARQDGTS